MLLTNLLTSDYGLMSLAVIVFILGMTVWFYVFFKRKMDEDERNSKR
jgi:cytochrome bd-type quinol oxidase subunit 2